MLQMMVVQENDERINLNTSFTEHLIPGDYFFGWQHGFFDDDFVAKFDATEIHRQPEVSDLRWDMYCEARDRLSKLYPTISFDINIQITDPDNKHALHVRRQAHRAYVLYCKGHKKLAHRVLDALLSREEITNF